MSLFEEKFNRARLARLDIDYKATTDNDAASVIIPAPGPGLVVSPFKIFATSTFRPNNGALATVLNGVRGQCDATELHISRHDTQGNMLTDIPTPMIRSGDFQTYLNLGVEVAAIKGVATLENTELRLWFPTKDALEAQYILVNYKIIRAREDIIP